MRSILSKLNAKQAGRPPAAIEITPSGVLAAALPALGLEQVCAFQALTPDCVIPSITKPNLRSPDDVSEAISSTLSKIRTQTRNVTLVLPDISIRVFLLDFDSLPSNDASAVPILRFRLRKVVPFDVENARVSYQILSRNDAGYWVLAAIMPNVALEEYETAVRAAEYEPGALLPSSLAVLAALDSPNPELITCLGDRWITTCITIGNELLLYRTLELATDPELRLSETRRHIAVAAAYYDDKFMNYPKRLYYSGIGTAQAFADTLDTSEIAIVALAAHSVAETLIPPAGVTGTLAGVR